MADVSATSSSSVLSDLSINSKTSDEVQANKELGQEEFLSLMTTQLQNQDPLAPMENGDFIAQLAQFGTVSGIGELQTSFDNLTAAMTAADASDAASLVGKSVLTEGDVGLLGEEHNLSGAIEVPEGVGNMQVLIESIGGEILASIDLPSQPAGLASFSWDGVLEDGTRVPAGHYAVTATGAGAQGPESLKTLMGSRVDSVSMGGDGKDVVLNLAGLGAKPLSEVSQLGL
ncbi:MAG: flagellar hook assembly protein FlgD [Granulosicoccaceae bacterium]